MPGTEKHAKDYRCVSCGKQAVAIWPDIDPDISSNPYCRKCLDELQTNILQMLFDRGPGGKEGR